MAESSIQAIVKEPADENLRWTDQAKTCKYSHGPLEVELNLNHRIVSMQPRFIADGDTISYEAHTCIVFTADGSGAQLIPMVTRSVAMEDNSALGCFDRCVDLAKTYGAEVRKTRSRTCASSYLVFYNLSPKLPVNRTLAHLVDFNPNDTSRLFWRGEVVVMKADLSRDPHVQCLDASMDDLASLQASLLDDYGSGRLEEQLSWDEHQWKFYCEQYCQSWLSYRLGAKQYWGTDFKQSEAEALDDINELRTLLGQPTLPPHPYMGGFSSLSRVVTNTVSSWIPSLSSTGITDAPKLVPDVERAIFEMCAKKHPQMCLNLVLVARRAKLWVDPILYEVVNLDRQGDDSRERSWDYRVQRFYSNNLLKPALPSGFYALHVKSLWIPPLFSTMSDANIGDQILAACSGVENLVIFTATSFLENPRAGQRLRRLTTKVTNLCIYSSDFRSIKVWPFEHACFTNLTHLHLYDDDDDWPTYHGWENLRSLTHLALACSGSPDTVAQLWEKLPRLSYMALGSYTTGKGWITINKAPYILAAWPKRVVFLNKLIVADWESGARGGEDVWALVEGEVDRRLAREEPADRN